MVNEDGYIENGIEIIENTKESIANFHKRGYGADTIELTKKEIQALYDGKCLALDDGEYTHVFYLRKGETK